MRSLKGFLAVLIVVVGLSPTASYAAPVLTVNGINALPSTCIANGTITCLPNDGNYGGSIVDFNVGGIASFRATDTATTDTLRLSNYRVQSSTDVTIFFSQSYITGAAGTYSYGDYQGGFFSTTAGVATPTRQVGDSSRTDGSVTTRNTTGTNVTTNLPQLSYTVSTTGSNSFTQNTPTTFTVVCSYAGTCQETFSNTVRLHFVGTDFINTTNSELHVITCIVGYSGACEPDPEGLQVVFDEERAADEADFVAAGGDLNCTGKLTSLPNANCRAGENGQSGRDNAGTRVASFALVGSADPGSPTIANPEPSTWLLFGTGLGALALWNRKRRKSDA